MWKYFITIVRLCTHGVWLLFWKLTIKYNNIILSKKWNFAPKINNFLCNIFKTFTFCRKMGFKVYSKYLYFEARGVLNIMWNSQGYSMSIFLTLLSNHMVYCGIIVLHSLHISYILSYFRWTKYQYSIFSVGKLHL